MTGTETITAPSAEFKEIQMDVRQEGGGTRRRRRARRSKTQRGGGEDGAEPRIHEVSVEKASSIALAPAPVIVSAPAAQTGGATVAKQLASKPAIKPTPKVAVAVAPTSSVIVLAPAKKKAKIMLVSKKGPVATIMPPKTFKAKRIRVTIDNTARTLKRRRQVLRSVDSLTEEQLREQAVKFGLSRTDSVKKAPTDLLRKMLKDYYAMRKGFL